MNLPEDNNPLPLLKLLEAEWQRAWEGEADEDAAEGGDNGAEAACGVAVHAECTAQACLLRCWQEGIVRNATLMV